MHVTRRRRPQGSWAGSTVWTGRRVRIVAAGTVAAAVAGGGMAAASTTIFDHHQVGTTYADGLQVSDNQVIKPIGDRLLTKYGKFMGSTVSPDGKYLAASSTDKSVALQIFDLSTYQLIWTVGTASGVNQKSTAATGTGTDNSVGQEGPTYSPDGKYLWLSQATHLTRYPVNANGTLGTAQPLPIATVNGKQPLPGQVTYSPDGSTIYVAVNGQNTVQSFDATTLAPKQSWDVGIAPRELAFVGNTLYVSNEGGRQARAGDQTMDSYGTPTPANGYLGRSTTGTVSVIDPSSTSVRSIDVGLHPTAMHTNGTALFVANTDDDTVSVIDPAKNAVVQTFDTRPWPSSDAGYQPNGIAMTKDGRILVTLGRANAVAVYQYNGTPQQPVSYIGLLPTDYYPSDVFTTPTGVVVSNTRGIDARGPELTFSKGQGTVPAVGHGTHSTTASLTRFALPSDKEIAKYTATVFAQNGWTAKDVEQGKGNGGGKAVAVPTRIGAPSTIKHVFLIVKENRTYDQVYGDDPRGNGDPSLAQFGEKATPNQHALERQFGLYDNTYDIGTNSAEGHNWMMQGDNPEYTESSAGEYTRSYDTEEDVLGHQRNGFLWTAVQDAGNSARNFGEFEYTEGKAPGTWQQYYCAARSAEGGDPSQVAAYSAASHYGSVIPSLNAIADPASPPFDTSIPDIYRYQVWKDDFEKNGPKNLNMFWLSSDHTGGPPSPEAQVADNDLAVGKIVDEISHSKYWKDSAIFVAEDDSQDGADHVDGHRAPVQIISPWAQHGVVDDTYYSQINMVRTIEQILGAQPLNQRLAAATPMFGAFTNKPDFTPFSAVPNQIPLTEGLAATAPPTCGLDTLGASGAAAASVNKQAAAAVAVPDAQKGVAAQWAAWAQQQHFTGSGAVPDSANPEQMNRYTWYQAHGWTTPYPGDHAIYGPAEVPGAYIPSSDHD